VDADGKVSECGIGMAGVALSYVRASKAEEYLVGRTLDRDMLRRGSGIASEETHPVSDTRGSSVYKREMVKVLCRHALETAAVRGRRRIPGRGDSQMKQSTRGRAAELAVSGRFLDALQNGPRGLVLAGEAGIGKTTLWKQVLAEARARSYWVLACRPTESETAL